MAKEIAKYMQPIINITNKSDKQLTADKGYSYQVYKRLISGVCQVLDKASPTFVEEQVRSRTRRDRAFRYTKEQREQLLNAPPSFYVTNPEPEPGIYESVSVVYLSVSLFSRSMSFGRITTIARTFGIEQTWTRK